MGDWLVFFRDGIAAWLPLFFAVLLVLMVYILWRTLQVMPRVTAAKTITSDSNVTWSDVAGLDEAKAELHEVVDFVRGSADVPELLTQIRLERHHVRADPGDDLRISAAHGVSQDAQRPCSSLPRPGPIPRA